MHKPIEVQAVQIVETSIGLHARATFSEMADWLDRAMERGQIEEAKSGRYFLVHGEVLGDYNLADPGDWIVQEIKGEQAILRVYTKHEFETTFEERFGV